MTSVQDWPTTPPTEPGWYWCQAPEWQRPRVVHVVVGRHPLGKGKLYAEAPGFQRSLSLKPARGIGVLSGARWRPGRIEP
jgi:hypothetical protein